MEAHALIATMTHRYIQQNVHFKAN